jgi:hypothetical protein
VDERVVSSDVVRMVYLLVFHAYFNEMHGSSRKIPSKKSRPYVYDISRLKAKNLPINSVATVQNVTLIFEAVNSAYWNRKAVSYC